MAGPDAGGGPTADRAQVNGLAPAALQDDGPSMQSGSAKTMTLSWFRRAGDANGPYPVPPNEYDGNDSAGITMFTNAEGDAEMRVDNSTARNPNGKWDMLVLHVEADGLGELNPPASGWDKGLVTQAFLDSSNFGLTVEQQGGDKTLDIAANQEGFEPGEYNRHTPHEVPPVMIFADTDEVEGDWLIDEAPDTGFYVWIDPNRASLSGGSGQFEPGETYQATWDIGGETQSSTFKMVDGTIETSDDITAANTFGETVTARTTLAAGSMVTAVLEPENGENQTSTVEVEGNTEYGGDTKGTVERGYVNAKFDFSQLGGSFDIHYYAPGYDASAEFTGDFRDQDVWLEPQNRIHVASGSGTVENVIDPDYTIPNATIRDSKTLTIAYTNPDHQTAEAIATQVGDGHLTGDSSIAYNTEVEDPYFDEMFLHYETSTDIFAAIRKSPGESGVEKFRNSPLDLTVQQTNADGEPKRLNLSRNASGVYVVPDNGESDPRLYNGSEQTGLFFSFKLNSMQFYQGDERVQPEPGDRFAATLTVETDAGIREETTHFRIVEGKTMIVNQPGELALPKSPDTEVKFNSTLAGGTAMGVRLVAESEDYDERSGELGLTGLGTQYCCDEAPTRPWGTAGPSFDTSSLPVGTEVTAYVMVVADLPGSYPDDLVVAEMSGEIVPPPSGTVSLSAQSGGGETVVVDSVELTRGGFVSVHTGSANGPTIGNSSYLDSGTHDNVEISLSQVLTETSTIYVTAHADTNNNQRFDFPVADDVIRVEGETVSASAEYTVEGGTDTTTSGDGGDGGDGGTDGDGDGDGGGGPIPGFGPAVALVALLTAALLARRRT